MATLKDVKLSVSIAMVHIRSKLRQTIVATVGVAFGIAVFIFMVSFIMGTNNYMMDITFEHSPHLRLYNEPTIAETTILDRKYPDWKNEVHNVRPRDVQLNLKDARQAIQEISQLQEVDAVAGSVKSQVFYRYGSNAINGLVNGIDFDNENRLFNLEEKLVEGSFREMNTIPNSLVMGEGLANRLNLSVGDRLNLTTEAGGTFSIVVIGLFKTGLTDIDRQQSYASLATVQRFLGVPASYITDIQAKLHDMDLAPQMLNKWKKRFGYQGSDWKEDHSTLLEGEALRSMIVYGVAITILLVAGFGIFNILTMMIYEKMKDIAILKAMGFSDTDVRYVFLFQALLIGAFGSVFGLIFGFLIAYAISTMPFESDVMVTLDHLPVSFETVYYIAGFTFGLITTFLAGYFPSRKAAKVDPISILRG
ncbi:ABC transporter permease [Pleomorphovibrio marinus]|uniref:ABC transporter permease n=1 Tax=Pleomorphovibrio marinus TaxID=2164132 RepID=UPI000E0A8A05|nr:ABC transporter permease [Pleomorphovibrio marinus]